VFQNLTKKQIQQIFGSIPLKYKFWDEFLFKELTISMRQKDDLIYFNMLNRIRVGSPTKEDIDLLKKQLMNIKIENNPFLNAIENYFELSKDYPNLICLYPKNDQTDAFNNEISIKLKIKNESIDAIDYIPNNKRNNFQIISKNKKKKLKYLKLPD
jgi:hypothetical protein